ncbi:unnamed protein product [Caenorhabditis nigoni]
MPIRILSLPVKDLQYVINSMDVIDSVAFSLCSKRTKNLVKASNRKIDFLRYPRRGTLHIFAQVRENFIRFNISTPESNYFNVFDSCIELGQGKLWRKPEFTLGDWISHILSIFNISMVHVLEICDSCPIYFVDNVKQVFRKCEELRIRGNCSRQLTNSAFFKLAPISDQVHVSNSIVDDENDISKFMSLNLKTLIFDDFENPFRLTAGDLMSLNIEEVLMGTANLSERELNRFLKLWMKSNHRFDRKKVITQHSRVKYREDQVFKGIKFEIVHEYYLLKREDGKELKAVLDYGFQIEFL